MDPSYEWVMEVTGLVWTLVAYLIHGAIVFVHLGLACFLIGTGVRDTLRCGFGLLLFAPLAAAENRNEELSWQLKSDLQSPKVGDLAPDFELQDPQGESRERLSDYRGKRPVALVFGSYT